MTGRTNTTNTKEDKTTIGRKTTTTNNDQTTSLK
jgi:hypothetical protein